MEFIYYSLDFLKGNHRFIFSLDYPRKLQIEFFMWGSENIFSFVFSHFWNSLIITNNTFSLQFAIKRAKHFSKMPQNPYKRWSFLSDLVTLTCFVFKANKNKQADSVILIMKNSFLKKWICSFFAWPRVKLKCWWTFKKSKE